MNPEFGPLETTQIESGIWSVLERIPGTDGRDTLELIYNWARRRTGIVVLNSPSIRVTVSAVLGALAAVSSIGTARVYIANSSRRQLALLFIAGHHSEDGQQ